MQNTTEQIEALDLDFKAIPSQTPDNEKRSLLAIQRATAKKYGSYAYLEIGSHLGGSIQPYLVDHRCEIIYSIDARPQQLPYDIRDAIAAHPIFHRGNTLDQDGVTEARALKCVRRSP